jgi:hypothetical protein
MTRGTLINYSLYTARYNLYTLDLDTASYLSYQLIWLLYIYICSCTVCEDMASVAVPKWAGPRSCST